MGVLAGQAATVKVSAFSIVADVPAALKALIAAVTVCEVSRLSHMNKRASGALVIFAGAYGSITANAGPSSTR